MTDDPDVALVHACRSGDSGAFGQLVGKYEAKLFNVAYRITGCREDALDATQTAFVKAYEKLDTFDPSYRFFSWIYRIAMNEALNLVRRRTPDTGTETAIIASSRSPEDAFADGETEQRVQEALMALKPDHRAVVVLKHFQGLSYREMSEVIGIPEKTVKSRLFTARQRLKGILVERRLVR